MPQTRPFSKLKKTLRRFVLRLRATSYKLAGAGPFAYPDLPPIAADR